jgi:hypothetical protein
MPVDPMDASMRTSNEPIDRNLVLAQYDEQVAAMERVCATMKEKRLQLEVAMTLSDAEFAKAMESVATEVAAEMDRAGSVLSNG